MAISRFRFVALAATVALVALPATAAPRGLAAAPPRLTLQEFVDRIARAGTIAEAPEPPTPERMNEVRLVLGLPVVLDLGGPTVEIGRDRFLDTLPGRDRGEFEAAAVHLDALDRSARSLLDAPALDPSRLDTALGVAYAGVRADPGWLERARRTVARLFAGLVDRLVNFRGPGSLLAWGVLAALALGLLVMLRRLSLVPERSRPDEGAPEDRRIDWERIAEEALARGDLETAARVRFRLLVAALSARGVLADEPSLTAGECRAAVRSAMPSVYRAVARATEVFELAAYAHARLERGDVEIVRDAERAVTAA